MVCYRARQQNPICIDFMNIFSPCRDVKYWAVWLKETKPYRKISERHPTHVYRTSFPLILPYFFFNISFRDRIKGLTPRAGFSSANFGLRNLRNFCNFSQEFYFLQKFHLKENDRDYKTLIIEDFLKIFEINQ